MNGIPGPPGLWNEAKNAEGRVYYYNTITKATQWTKPLELMTPAEVSMTLYTIMLTANEVQRALANQPWQEFKTPEGRPYWYNKETKQSSWQMPEVYRDALNQTTASTKPAVP